MPLMKGKGHAIVSKNIKELVGAGHDPKQAIAIALSNARKYAMGGMVDDEESELNRSLGEINADGVDYDSAISNPEDQKEHMAFAQMLHKKAMADMDAEGYAMGGLVEGASDTALGNKPDEDMDDETEESMSSMPKKMADGGMIDADMMKAIEDKKKKRRYM